MHAALLLLAISSVGVDTGWQPLDDGGFEYIIQIEPQLLDALRRGEEITSDIPLNLRGVRSYRIRVGTGELPRVGNPPRAAAEPPTPAEAEPPPARAGEPPVEPEPEIPSLRQRIPLRSGFDNMRPPQIDRYPDRGQPTEPTPAAADNQAGNEPRTFAPPAAVQQISGYRDDTEAGPSGKAIKEPSMPKAKVDPNEVTPAARPWFQLTVALLALFVSLGGNAYLALQWWSLRCRCQDLMHRQRGLPGRSRPSVRRQEADDEADEEDDEDQEVRAVAEVSRPQRQRTR